MRKGISASDFIKYAIGIAIMFVCLSVIIIPYWNTTASANVAGTGLSSSAFQGLMTIIFLAVVGAIIYKVTQGQK